MTRPYDAVNYEFTESYILSLAAQSRFHTLFPMDTSANSQAEIFYRLGENCKGAPPILEQYNATARAQQINSAQTGFINDQDFIRTDLPIAFSDFSHVIGNGSFPPGWEGEITFTDFIWLYQWPGFSEPEKLISIQKICFEWKLIVETNTRVFVRQYVVNDSTVKPENGNVYVETVAGSLGSTLAYKINFTTVQKINFNFLLVTLPQCMFSGFPADKSGVELLPPDSEAQRGNYGQMPIEKQTHLANNALILPFQLRKG